MSIPTAVLTTVLLSLTAGGVVANDNQAETIAKVGETTITLAEVDKKASETLSKLEINRIRFLAQDKRETHNARYEAVKSLIEINLLKQEAASRGITLEELIAQDITAKIEQPTMAEMEALYQEKKEQLQGPKDEALKRVQQYLVYQRQQKVGTDLVNGLKNKFPIKIWMQPYRIDINSQGHPTLGSPDAPITIAVFSNFECSLCAKLEPELGRLREFYKEKVKMVFFQHPPNMESNAVIPAEACLCAAEQGAFEPMFTAIYADQKRLGSADMINTARQLGIDAQALNTCLSTRRYRDQVASDITTGAHVGVMGTPSVFVNGRHLSGALSFDTIATIIDEELKRIELGL